MSFHFSNFGQFSNEIKEYADLDGHVPEAGDDWFSFRWDAAIRWTKDAWQEHVEGAVRATVRAERALDAWREGRPDPEDDQAEEITATTPDGRQGILTTEHAASSYGLAVLVVGGEAIGCGEVGPLRIATEAGRDVARRAGYQVVE